MKKIALSLVLASLSVMPVVALAAANTTAPNLDVMATLTKITDWLFAILLVVAAIAIIIAAFQFITASGDPEKVGSARQFVLYAMIGVLVALLAKGLVALVNTIVT